MTFTVITNKFNGLKIIETEFFSDQRGYFFESYKFSEFSQKVTGEKIIQTNQSLSYNNVIRGLHFQLPESAQAKMIRCVIGEIYDVVLDLRKSSPTFGKSFGINLSQENRKMLYVPIGFAHGFSTLSENAEVVYNIFGSEYNPAAERGVRFDDEDLKIDWKVVSPIVSSKDLALPYLRNLKTFF